MGEFHRGSQSKVDHGRVHRYFHPRTQPTLNSLCFPTYFGDYPMSSFFMLDSLTRERRQLRQNIRNAYCASTIPELLFSQRMRAMAKRDGFELACFDELIAEATEEQRSKV
jgi:hypothetical protein